MTTPLVSNIFETHDRAIKQESDAFREKYEYKEQEDYNDIARCNMCHSTYLSDQVKIEMHIIGTHIVRRKTYLLCRLSANELI